MPQAIANVVQDMMQMKYGLCLDDADLARKVRHYCSGCGIEEALAAINAQADLHFQVRGGRRLVRLRIDKGVSQTFEERPKLSLLSQVSLIDGWTRMLIICGRQ